MRRDGDNKSHLLIKRKCYFSDDRAETGHVFEVPRKNSFLAQTSLNTFDERGATRGWRIVQLHRPSVQGDLPDDRYSSPHRTDSTHGETLLTRVAIGAGVDREGDAGVSWRSHSNH